MCTQTDGDLTTGTLITPRTSPDAATAEADAQTEPIPVNEHPHVGVTTDGGEPAEGDTIMIPTQHETPAPPQPEAVDTQYTPDFDAVIERKLVEQEATAAEEKAADTTEEHAELLNPRDQHGRTMRRKVANKKNPEVHKVAISVSCR